MHEEIYRWSTTLCVIGFLACAGIPESRDDVSAKSAAPRSYEECVAAGGIHQPSFLGDRCIAIVPQPGGRYAYPDCRKSGGVPLDAGFDDMRGYLYGGHRLAGDSVRCILVFTGEPGWCGVPSPRRHPIRGCTVQAPRSEGP
jgi:hypothetical protein